MENNQNTQNHENNMLLNNFKYLYTLAQEYTEQDKFETMQRKKQEHDGQIAQYQATITYHDGERVRLDAILVELAKRYETVFRDYEVSENLLKQHQSILKKAVGDWEAVAERIDTEKLIDVEKRNEELKAEIDERKKMIDDNRQKNRKFLEYNMQYKMLCTAEKRMEAEIEAVKMIH